MKFLDNYRNKKEEREIKKEIERNKRLYNALSDSEKELMRILGITPNNDMSSLNSATYLACIKLISESIGKLPLNLNQFDNGKTLKNVKNSKYNFLQYRVNKWMTPSLFWQQVVFHIFHFGNAYVYMNYKGYKLEGLYLLNPKCVSPIVDNKSLLDSSTKIYYQYNEVSTGQVYTFSEDNVLHFKNSILDSSGLIGLSIFDLLYTQINNELESTNYMNSLIKGGLSGKHVLQYVGDLDTKAQEKLILGLENFAKGKNSTQGNIIPLPLGFNLSSINSKLIDVEFLDECKFNTTQIASVFGISSSYLNIDSTSSSYSNSEQETLRFMQSIQFLIQNIEDELSYKLLTSTEQNKGMYFEFDTQYLLRTSLKDQAEILVSYVNNGIYTINEAREILGMPNVENGDNLFLQGGQASLDVIVQGLNYTNDGNLLLEGGEDDNGERS